MKKRTKSNYRWKKLHKMLLIVQLKIFLICCSNVYAQNSAQLFSFNKKDILIEQVLEKVQKESDYTFFYEKGILKDYRVENLNVDKVNIKELMDRLLTNLLLEYTQNQEVITIKKKIEKTIYALNGVVTDNSGNPIPGATILLKNSVLGSVTGVNGQFTLNVPRTLGPNFSLLVSFIGMKTVEVPYSGKNKLEIVLYDEEQQLDEVVVTGYQVIDKRVLTSSIETITADDLDKVGALTVDQMLEGKAAGLMITNSSSTPGAAAKVRVRSGGTFTGSRAPLWVVDGIIYEDPVPLSADDINSFDQVNLIGNALTGLNPQDIASINILKDASATAIYGTRAANGVIVITTKRGKAGSTSLNYSANVNITDRPYYRNFNLMNSKERVGVSKEIEAKNLGYPTPIFTYLGYEKALYDYKSGLISFTQFQSEVGRIETMNVDWFDALYRPVISTDQNVNLSGGNEKMRFYFSVGYNNTQGTEIGVGLNRVTARSNIDVNLRKNFKVSLGMSGSVQEAEYNHSSINVFDQAYYNSRTTPIYNEDGSLFYVQNKIKNSTKSNMKTYGYNILNEISNSNKVIDNKEFNINAQVVWDIVKGIKLQGSASYRNTTNLQEEWIAENTAYMAQLRTYDGMDDAVAEWVKKYAMAPFGGIYSGAMTSQRSLRAQTQLNLSKVLAERHVFNLNLGYEASSARYKGSNGWQSPGYNHTQGRSFIALPAFTPPPSYDVSDYEYVNMIRWLTSGSAMDIYPSVVDRLTNQLSMFGIFNYSYDNRYIINFNMRSDGSNQFGQYERYKFKPTWSVSGRWNTHSEHFWNKSGMLEELAFRVSYGFRGTPPSTLPYMIIRDYVYSSDYLENIASLSSMPNANLTWEKTSTLNAGVNYSLFKGRLSGSFDFAYSHGVDLLLSRPVSLVNGTSTQNYNGGEKKDYSYEMSISSVLVKKKDWGWRLSANITKTDEKILAGFEASKTSDYNIENYLNGSIYLTGFPIDGFYSYQFDSLNEEGLPQYKNLTKGYGNIATAFKETLTYSGRRSPKVYGGFSTEFRYKQLTLRSSFSYKLGHHIRRLKLYQGQQNMPMPHENMSSEFNNRWRQAGDEIFAKIPALSNNPLDISTTGLGYYKTQFQEITPVGASGYSLYDLSDARVVSGSHIRWQSVSLGYSLPNKNLKKIGFTSLRVNGSVNNLGVWAFDSNLKGQDPEQIQGVGMPALPTYVISLSLGF